VLEQRKTILKVLLSCVSSQKNKFTVLEKRKYCNGIFTEMVPTHARPIKCPCCPAHEQDRPRTTGSMITRTAARSARMGASRVGVLFFISGLNDTNRTCSASDKTGLRIQGTTVHCRLR
jgi:hypothetical protein